MPTYEYRCEKGHAFERVQKMSDKPVAKCPVCGSKAVRVISGGQGLIFKGSGFYITDYGKDGKGPRKDAESPAGEAKKESKAEATAKPAATSDAKPDAPAKAVKPGKPESA